MTQLCRAARAAASGAEGRCAPLSSQNDRVAGGHKEMRREAQNQDKKSPGEQGCAGA